MQFYIDNIHLETLEWVGESGGVGWGVWGSGLGSLWDDIPILASVQYMGHCISKEICPMQENI